MEEENLPPNDMQNQSKESTLQREFDMERIRRRGNYVNANDSLFDVQLNRNNMDDANSRLKKAKTEKIRKKIMSVRASTLDAKTKISNMRETMKVFFVVPLASRLTTKMAQPFAHIAANIGEWMLPTFGQWNDYCNVNNIAIESADSALAGISYSGKLMLPLKNTVVEYIPVGEDEEMSETCLENDDKNVDIDDLDFFKNVQNSGDIFDEQPTNVHIDALGSQFPGNPANFFSVETFKYTLKFVYYSLYFSFQSKFHKKLPFGENVPDIAFLYKLALLIDPFDTLRLRVAIEHPTISNGISSGVNEIVTKHIGDGMTQAIDDNFDLGENVGAYEDMCKNLMGIMKSYKQDNSKGYSMLPNFISNLMYMYTKSLSFRKEMCALKNEIDIESRKCGSFIAHNKSLVGNPQIFNLNKKSIMKAMKYNNIVAQGNIISQNDVDSYLQKYSGLQKFPVIPTMEEWCTQKGPMFMELVKMTANVSRSHLSNIADEICREMVANKFSSQFYFLFPAMQAPVGSPIRSFKEVAPLIKLMRVNYAKYTTYVSNPTAKNVPKFMRSVGAQAENLLNVVKKVGHDNRLIFERNDDIQTLADIQREIEVGMNAHGIEELEKKVDEAVSENMVLESDDDELITSNFSINDNLSSLMVERSSERRNSVQTRSMRKEREHNN